MTLNSVSLPESGWCRVSGWCSRSRTEVQHPCSRLPAVPHQVRRLPSLTTRLRVTRNKNKKKPPPCLLSPLLEVAAYISLHGGRVPSLRCPPPASLPNDDSVPGLGRGVVNGGINADGMHGMSGLNHTSVRADVGVCSALRMISATQYTRKTPSASPPPCLPVSPKHTQTCTHTSPWCCANISVCHLP